MPRKPAKKRDFSKSSIGRDMLARVRCIHEALQPDVPQYDEKIGAVEYPNATDIQRHLMADDACGKKYSLNTIRRDIKFMRESWTLKYSFRGASGTIDIKGIFAYAFKEHIQERKN